MSRPDTHPPDFEFPPFDSRDFQFSSQGIGATGHLRRNPLGMRDNIRDSPRDFPPPRDVANIYNSSSANPYIPADHGRPNAGGFPTSAVSPPRMYNVNAHHAGGLGSHDAWAPNLPSGPLSNHRPNVGPPAVLPAASSPGNHLQQGGPQSLAVNHHHRASPPRSSAAFATPPPASAFTDRDRDAFRDLYYTTRLGQQQQTNINPPSSVQHALPPALSSPTSTTSPRSTLWWGELEPWMDEEYAKQVCNLMGWDPVNIKVPRPAPDPLTGRQANNPGYCFLTFPSQQHAASVLGQINNTNGGPLSMPNSARPFTLNWASSVPTAPLAPGFGAPTISIPGAQNPQYPKEYSIFVGDLAPEVSNSDLVAVFRNPVLGLRNDREPRFIRPFLSCKSAKIMLDPVTGVSRGYGFVRFTDESDQQRALIEMHGLYCLSRPMRISPATAKFKPAPGVPGIEYAHLGYPGVSVALPLPNTSQTKSVSTPLASSNVNASISGASLSSTVLSGSSSLTAPSLSSNSSSASSSTLASAPSDTEIITTPQGQGPSGATPTSATSPAPNPTANNSISAGLAQQTQDQLMAQRYNIPEESWKHHAQARAILSNLIGPNGEQLTSSDPYNTTVFVGGLSPLISEDTLRTFFVPFGDIHYVKVPVGKHCGFVQFVRKPDAERAIEKMQGFPIGGSRIRLSWGRSQYKAAQAAAQAAQTAALQVQYQPVPATPSPPSVPSLTPEQAIQLLEKFGIAQFLQNPAMMNETPTADGNRTPAPQIKKESEYNYNAPSFDSRSSGQFSTTSFSPFSPDPNYLIEGEKGINVGTSPQPGSAQNFSAFTNGKGYAPWYTAPQPDDKTSTSSGKISPTGNPTARPSSATQRFGSFLSETQAVSPFQTRSSSRQEGPIARPDATRRHSQVLSSQEHEHDVIQDLNGTLASLDLDNAQLPWKSVNGEGTKLVALSK
ncbi:hypothetical protein QCA50_000783 [Cerrena zonata]|uniref:RRM domain-containing protein n=1 Tax=Cerrena zonata TaxID=2478898 RepID=A0AAW0GSC2_9APHY